jgi:hypothetical protein
MCNTYIQVHGSGFNQTERYQLRYSRAFSSSELLLDQIAVNGTAAAGTTAGTGSNTTATASATNTATAAAAGTGGATATTATANSAAAPEQRVHSVPEAPDAALNCTVSSTTLMFCEGVDWGSRYAGGDVIIDLVTWQPLVVVNSTDPTGSTNTTIMVAVPVLRSAAQPLTVTAVPQFRSKSATEGERFTYYYCKFLGATVCCKLSQCCKT